MSSGETGLSGWCNIWWLLLSCDRVPDVEYDIDLSTEGQIEVSVLIVFNVFVYTVSAYILSEDKEINEKLKTMVARSAI
ncbi:MAG: hypothetical protein P8105_05195 [Dehalococcoidia bacterium]